MVDNIKDVFRIITEYMGSGFYVILYGLALIWLLIREKDRLVRFLLGWLPLLLLLIYLCPVYYRIYVLHLDSHGTYYRNLWLLPMGVTIAYAACSLIRSHRRIGAVIICGLLVVCGSFAFTSSAKVQNTYHIPQYCIDLCDAMEQDIEGVNVYACVPLELLFYVRQYDADINLVYGRDAAEPVWGYYNETYEAYELSEELNWDTVLELTRDSSLGVGVVTYFVVPADRQMNADPGAYRLTEVCRADNYILYADEIAREHVREILADTPYMK